MAAVGRPSPASRARIGRQILTPRSAACRHMSSVPRPPGNATTPSGRMSSIWPFRMGPATRPWAVHHSARTSMHSTRRSAAQRFAKASAPSSQARRHKPACALPLVYRASTSLTDDLAPTYLSKLGRYLQQFLRKLTACMHRICILLVTRNPPVAALARNRHFVRLSLCHALPQGAEMIPRLLEH